MDTLRGGAVVAVVVMHAELAVVGETGRELPLLHAVNEVLGPIRMPMLVLLSGLLVQRSLAKGWGGHLRGKVVHILWPYAVWALLDVAHVQLDALYYGTPLRLELLWQLAYDPHTYLWFLAYLFAFHLLVTPFGPAARTLGIPVAFLLAAGLDPAGSAHKFWWLFAFFLLGDLTARTLTGRVPTPVAAAAAYVRWAPLARVGRSSLVYYACHLLVLVYAARVAHAAGVTDPVLLWLTIVVVALAVGAALDRGRRSSVVEVLFSFPLDRRQRSCVRHAVPPNHLHATPRHINLLV